MLYARRVNLCVSWIMQGIRESSIVDATLSKVRLQQFMSCCISYMHEGLPPSACKNLYVLAQLSHPCLATAFPCFKVSIRHCWLQMQTDQDRACPFKMLEPWCSVHFRLMR